MGNGLVLNIEMFLIAEVLILFFALVIAVLRQLRNPVLFPFRMLAVVYTDVFRGVPLIIVIYAIGFGAPALVPAGHLDPVRLRLRDRCPRALVLRVCGRGVPGRASTRSTAARWPRPARSGCRSWKSLRYVVLPQAVRTVIPPLLNDFISLQKDTALVSTLGAVIEANRAAQIDSSTLFVYSSYTVAALLFLCLTIPLARFTDHLIARDVSRRMAGAVRVTEPEPIAASGGGVLGSARQPRRRGGPARRSSQVVRLLGGAARHRPVGRHPRGHLPHRGVGFRQVDAASLRESARAHQRGPDLAMGPGGHCAGSGRERACDATSASSSSPSTSSPT